MHPYQHPLFAEFIVYFNRNEDYFECHEVLEEYWKSIPDHDKGHPLTAFILLSTAMYHWRRDNFAGASRTLQKAQKNFSSFSRRQLFMEHIDFERLQLNIKQSLESLEMNDPFKSFKLCITSSNLKALITEVALSMELLPFGSDAVIHKHMLRDRSDILREREEKKKGRGH